MKLDRFKFRAWIEIPLTQEDGEEFNFNLCLYGVDVLSDGNFAGFDEWLLGDTLSEIKLTDKQKDEVWRFCEDNNIFNSDTYYCIPVDRIEQCAGLSDKNGKWIFEGDIVTMGADCFCADVEQVGKPCYVEFGDMGFWFIYPQLDNEHKSAGWNECAEYEVVGNIHENKNLLEAP